MSDVAKRLYREQIAKMSTGMIRGFLHKLSKQYAEGDEGMEIEGVAPIDRMQMYANELEKRDEQEAAEDQ
jgi:hypothetical protein